MKKESNVRVGSDAEMMEDLSVFDSFLFKLGQI